MNPPLEFSVLMERHHLVGWRKTAARPQALPDCALIVPTYRRCQELLRLLNAMTEIAHVPAEFLVIDGSPGDEVNRALQTWAMKQDLLFDLIYLRSPAGLTRQRNVGVELCEKEFIFFLDDDCVPEPDYFTAIRQVFLDDKNGEVGAVRGFIINGIDQPITPLWRLRHALKIVPRGEPGQYHHCGTSGTWNGVKPFSGTRPIDLLAGGAAAYRRTVFSQHRFSEFFGGYAQGEDFEMSLRLRRDWKLLLCGNALVDHREASRGRPPGFARGRMVVRNRYFIWKRHSPKPGLLNGVRFWMDHALTILFYSGCFLVRPWRPYYLTYMIGTAFGLVELLIFPPEYSEPPVRREYTFRLHKLNRALVAQEVA